MEAFKPSGTGESPLANAGEWLDYTCPETGMKGRRETNTMPQWAGSCWYYLRYIDPLNDDAAFDFEKAKYWLPVDLYVGGAEHAVLHLLYARFWHKVLFDLGLVTTKEPFQKLVNQGMILGQSYKNERGALVPNDQVEEKGGKFFDTNSGDELVEFAAKMSKSLKNVVNPDDVICEYGADSMRLYEMFMGQFEATKSWNTKGVEGVHRFLKKVWRMITESEIVDKEMDADQLRLAHATIKKVTEDLDNMSFNTAISQMMIFTNEFSKCDILPSEAADIIVKVLAPFAPHMCEELWQFLGHKEETLSYVEWPDYNEEYLKVSEVEILVQVHGKAKTKIMMPVEATKDDMEKIVLDHDEVQSVIEGKTIHKVICVPGRLVNLIAS